MASARYFTTKRYTPRRRKAEERTISCSISSSPITRRISTMVATAAMGIITELVRKSKKLRMSMPIGAMWDRALKPRQDRQPSAVRITLTSAAAFGRLQFSSSSKVAQAVSARETELVSAAISTSRKNSTPVQAPPIDSNTLGSVTNISEGPWRRRTPPGSPSGPPARRWRCRRSPPARWSARCPHPCRYRSRR